MKKNWENAEVEELVIGATANGDEPNKNFDSDWVSINGKWYLPGNGTGSGK